MTDDLVRQLAAAIRWGHPLDHFATLAHTLTGLGDPDGAVCALARDSIRRALLAGGI